MRALAHFFPGHIPMKKYFALLFLLNTSTGNALDISGVTNSIDHQRPLLKAQAQTITHAQHLERKASAAYLPQLSTSHVSSFSQEHSTIDKSTHTLSLTGKQLIFSPNGPQLQRKIAATATQQAQHAFTATSNQAHHDGVHAFLDAWLLQEKKDVIDLLSHYSDHLNAQVNAQHVSGGMSTPDALAQHATITQNQATITAYYHEQSAARAQLRRAMGSHHYSDSTPLHFTPQSSTNLLPLSEYIAMAYAYRPELKQKTAALEQHRLNARSHRLSYLPSVHLHGSVGRTFSGTGPDRGTDANVGISASWQFFDGMQQRYAAQASDANLLRTQFEHQELRNKITQEVTTTYHTMHASLAAIRAAHAQSRAQQQLAQRERTAHHLGMLNNIDHAKQAYTAARARHELLAQQVALRKHQETLFLYCGCPPHFFSAKESA